MSRALLCCLVESVAEGLVHLLQTKILRKNRFEQLCVPLNSMSCFPVQMKEASLGLDQDSRSCRLFSPNGDKGHRWGLLWFPHSLPCCPWTYELVSTLLTGVAHCWPPNSPMVSKGKPG